VSPIKTEPGTPVSAQSSAASAQQNTSLLKFVGTGFCVAVTVCVLLVVAFELFAYKFYLPAAQNQLEPAVKLELAQNGNDASRDYWKEFQKANKVVYHQYVLWRRAAYNGNMVVIDKDGIRRTFNTQCDDKTYTIWMYGDSVMWGAGAPDDSTIPSYVAEDYKRSGRPVCVVNFAERGWSNSQEMIGLIEELKHAARKPDIVLFYDGGTEAFTAYQSGRADVHSNYSQFKGFLDNFEESQKAGFSYLRQTNSYKFLEKMASKTPLHNQKAAAQPKATRDTATLSAAVVDNYQQNMRIIDVLAKEFGFRPVFAWYPNMFVGHKQLTSYEQDVLDMEQTHFPGLGEMYQTVYQRGAQEIKNPDFLDLTSILDDQKDSMYVGISHLRPEGNRVVADRLFDLLTKNNASHSTSASAGSTSGLLASKN
jgi:hypothetical protein